MSLKSFASRVLNAKPTMYADSLVANAFGYQWMRIFAFYLWRTARAPVGISSEFEPYLTELMKYGIVRIPNFLPKETHAAIVRAFGELDTAFTLDQSEIGLPHVKRLSLYDPRVDETIRRAFTESKLIRSVAERYLNRRYHFPLQAYLTKIFCNEEELAEPKNGGTNNVHFDAPTRVFKAFYYVTDTTVDNGPLTYCFGSNRRTSPSRWWLEYKLSVRYAKNRGNPDHNGEYLTERSWVKVTPEEMRRYGFAETPVTGGANTLVLADTGGFHRRGAFQKAGVRQTVEINFRSVETLHNSLFSLEEALRPIFSHSSEPLKT